MYNHGACSGQAGRRIPRVRGWERGIAASEADPAVHPARARVGTTRAADRPGREGSSRACAGGKNATTPKPAGPWFIPRVRGWEGLYCAGHCRWLDHPARARVERRDVLNGQRRHGSSRACAGGKHAGGTAVVVIAFIPRVRGWEVGLGRLATSARDHPARARVERGSQPAAAWGCRSSRACAGGKNLMLGTRLMSSIIPRVRGWKRSGCGCCWS